MLKRNFFIALCLISLLICLASCNSTNRGNVSGNAENGIVSDGEMNDNSGGALGRAVDGVSDFVSDVESDFVSDMAPGNDISGVA